MIAWTSALALAGGLTATLSEVEGFRGARLTDAAPAIPAEAYVTAEQGQVVTGLEAVAGSSIRKAWGVGVVSVPIERMWAAINDDRSKPKITRLAHLELLDGEYCSARRTVFQYLPVTMASDRWWVVEQQANAALAQQSSGKVRELTWRSLDDAPARLNDTARGWADQGLQVPFTEGAWLLVDLGGDRTLVEYYAWSDPGGSIPAGIASRFAAGGIEDTIASMAELARSGPSCKGP